MNVPPFTPIPAAQEEPPHGQGPFATPASAAGLLSRRQIRSITDWLTSAIIKTGGIGIILCILWMCIFLVKEVVPLFVPTQAASTEPIPLSAAERPSSAALVGVDEYQELAYVLRGDSLEFVFLPGSTPLTSPIPSRRLIPEGSVTAVARALGKGHSLAMGTADGRVIPVTIEFTQDFQGNERSITPSVLVGTPMAAAPTPQPIARMAYQSTDSEARIAALLQDQHLWLTTSRRTSRPDGTADASSTQVDLTPHIPGRITALTLGSRAGLLAVGTETGKVYHFDLRDPAAPGLTEITQAAERSEAITSLAYLMGDRSLVVGGASGQIAVWMPVREHAATNTTHMMRIHQFSPHERAVTDITISQRDKGFLTADAGGEIRLHHSTSEQTLLTLAPQQGALRSTYFSPKADGLVGLTEDHRLIHYQIANPYPEITWAALFSPVWYEGYD